MKNICQFDLSHSWFSKDEWEYIFLHIVNSYGSIDLLDVSHADLVDVDVDLLVEVLCMSRKINITYLSGISILTIFEKISKLNEGQIQEMQVNGYMLDVSKELFSRTLSQLSKVVFDDHSILSEGQLLTLMDKSNDGTKITRDVSTGGFLIRDIGNLHGTRLILEDFSQLTSSTWTTILTSVGDKNSKLRELNIDGAYEGGVNLMDISPGVISNALSRLSRISLSDVVLSPTQWTKVLLTHTATDLSLRMVNLSDVEARLLARSLTSCHTLSLEFSALTNLQWRSVLESCASSSSNISSIKLSNIDLSKIPSQLLTSVVGKCSSINFSSTNLTHDQVSDILTCVIMSNNLKYLNLNSCNLSTIPESTLARAVVNVDSVHLRKTKLTNSQVTSLMAANLGRSKLRQLDLSNVNMSGVDSELLSLAVTRLRQVSLFCTFLTRDQMSRLVDQVEKFTRLEYLKLQTTSANLIPHELKKRLSKSIKFEHNW